MANVIKSTSQTATYMATGTLDEDISEVITNISPEDTPFLSTFKAAEDATELDFSWFLDELRPPRINAFTEMEDYQSENVQGLGRMSNTIQRFRRSAKVSDDMQKVQKLYKPTDEMARQMAIKAKELAQDMEMALVQNQTSRMDAGVTPALTGGVPYFLKEELQAVTVAGNVFSVTGTHGLSTGDFILLRAETSLDTGLDENTRYYVHLDATTPTTSFTIHNSIEDAINGVNEITIAGDAVGDRSILKNNVIDCGGNPYTEANINDALELLYYRGGNATRAYMSGANKRRFTTTMGLVVKAEREQTDKKIISNVMAYEGDFGTVEVATHRYYPDNVIDILDMSMWHLKYFERPHVVELPVKGPYTEKILKAAMGLKGTQPLASARLTNIGK